MKTASRPRVSLLMAVHDGADHLQASIESLLAQRFEDFELILIDDGSADASPEILDRFDDPRIRRHRNPENLGLTASLVQASRMARADLIARQDADDLSHPDRLARQVAELDRNPDLALIGSAADVIDARGRVIARVDVPDGDLGPVLQRYNPLLHGTVMLRKAALEAAGGYDPRQRYAQDYDLWLRIAERYPIRALPDALYAWRFSPGAITVSKAREQVACIEAARLAGQRRRAARATDTTTGHASIVETDDAPDATIGIQTDFESRGMTDVPPQRLSSALAMQSLRLAYYALAAGEQGQAWEFLQRAAECSAPELDDRDAMRDWWLQRAQEQADLRGPRAGLALLEGLFEALPEGLAAGSRQRRHWIGQHLVRQGYRLAGRGDLVAARRSMRAALRRDPRWWTDRGVWSLVLRA